MEISEKGSVHIIASFNNTIVSATDTYQNTILKTSADELGFKGFQKKSPSAASQVAEIVAKEAMKHGIKSVDVFCRGQGIGRVAAINTLLTVGLEVSMIKDSTPVPHNGCRTIKNRILEYNKR